MSQLRSTLSPQGNKHLSGAVRLLCAALALLVAFTALPPLQAGAVTQAEINALKEKQKQISNSKSSIQDKITAVQNDKAQAVKKKTLIEEQIEVIRQELEVTNALIKQLDQQIIEKTAELEAAQEEEREYTKLFNQRVRSMEEQGTVSYWSVLFNSASFSDLLDNMNMVSEIMDHDNQVMDELERIRITIADAKTQLETARAEQQAAKDQLEASNAQLKSQQKEVDALVKQIEAAESEYRDQLHEMDMNSNSLSKEIAAAEKKYAEQLAAQQGTSSGNGGYLWPLPPGHTNSSSEYGWRNCPFHGRELHTGIDLPAKAGTEIYASKGGTVIISTYNSSYGNYVVIAHPEGGKTLYAHMKSRVATVGSTVKQGQVIGYVGTTGSSTGNHLHFEVWKGSTSSTRVNPRSCF